MMIIIYCPQRFRALFTLKSIGGQNAVDWMAKAFNDESALLKHEVEIKNHIVGISIDALSNAGGLLPRAVAI